MTGSWCKNTPLNGWANGGPLTDPHIPHRLVAKNSLGQTVQMTAIIKNPGE